MGKFETAISQHAGDPADPAYDIALQVQCVIIEADRRDAAGEDAMAILGYEYATKTFQKNILGVKEDERVSMTSRVHTQLIEMGAKGQWLRDLYQNGPVSWEEMQAYLLESKLPFPQAAQSPPLPRF